MVVNSIEVSVDLSEHHQTPAYNAPELLHCRCIGILHVLNQGQSMA